MGVTLGEAPIFCLYAATATMDLHVHVSRSCPSTNSKVTSGDRGFRPSLACTCHTSTSILSIPPFGALVAVSHQATRSYQRTGTTPTRHVRPSRTKATGAPATIFTSKEFMPATLPAGTDTRHRRPLGWGHD